MKEVRSIGWIKQDARRAAEQFDSHGTQPVNPCAPGTDAHRVWAATYYTHQIDIEISQAA